MALFQFFSAPVGTYGNALINWASHPARDLISYASSYRGAAMNLVDFRAQRGIGSIDHSALPILFLYRHAFELYLKTIVFKAAILSINEEELASVIPRLLKEHSLLALVGMASPVLSASISRPLTLSGELEECIRNLAEKSMKLTRGRIPSGIQLLRVVIQRCRQHFLQISLYFRSRWNTYWTIWRSSVRLLKMSAFKPPIK